MVAVGVLGCPIGNLVGKLRFPPGNLSARKIAEARRADRLALAKHRTPLAKKKEGSPKAPSLETVTLEALCHDTANGTGVVSANFSYGVYLNAANKVVTPGVPGSRGTLSS